jgi:hypothetical protein
VSCTYVTMSWIDGIDSKWLTYMLSCDDIMHDLAIRTTLELKALILLKLTTPICDSIVEQVRQAA